MKTLVFAIIFTLLSTLAYAETWCVPDETIRDVCPNVAASLQDAHDLATTGSTIFVGPGLAPGRLEWTRRMVFQCLPGAVITDAGLAPSDGPVAHINGVMTSPRMEKCVIDVTASAGAILLEPEAVFANLKGLTLSSSASPRPAYGLRVWDNPRVFFIGASSTRPVVRGFDVGIDSRLGGWLDVEAGSLGGVLFEGNGTGIRSDRDKGQIFFNEFRGNEVGIHTLGNFHQDVNANQFFGNGIGLLWGLSETPNPNSGVTVQKVMEFNHPVMEGNTIAIQVEVSPGVFSTDYHDDPGCFLQWTDMTIDGVLQPNFKLSGPCVSP